MFEGGFHAQNNQQSYVRVLINVYCSSFLLFVRESLETNSISELMFYLLSHMHLALRFREISSRPGPGWVNHSLIWGSFNFVSLSNLVSLS